MRNQNSVSTEYRLVVRYAETDSQGIVHHANYLIWFEEGRSDFLRQMGFHYSDLEKDGYFVVVTSVSVKYRSPAFYEDELKIQTTLESMKGKGMEFFYRVLNSAGQLLAEGKTSHLVLNEKRRTAKLPERFLRKLSGKG